MRLAITLLLVHMDNKPVCPSLVSKNSAEKKIKIFMKANVTKGKGCNNLQRLALSLTERVHYFPPDVT